MRLIRKEFDTPVGPMMALASDAALCALEFSRPGRMTRLETRLWRFFAPFELEDGTNAVIAQAVEWLNRYFAGERPEDPPLDMRGNAFELKVWAALRQIPYGQTTSYGEIARQIRAPAASRAVGMANGANPIAIIVPCHRVIGSNGTLTGYGGGLDRKKWLLNHEGGLPEIPEASGRLPLYD